MLLLHVNSNLYHKQYNSSNKQCLSIFYWNSTYASLNSKYEICSYKKKKKKRIKSTKESCLE